MGGGNSGFSRTRGKAAPNPYDLKPGKTPDFQNAFPFGTSKSGKAAVAVVGGVPTLAVLGLIRRKVRSKAALSPDGSTRAPRLMGEDYVYNSRTSGPKKAIYGPPRKPSAPTRPFIEADAPIRSVTASKVSDKTRNAVRNVASDLGRVPRTIFDLNYDPTAPNPKTFPNARANVGKAVQAPAAPFKSDYKPQVRTFDPMVGKAPAPAKPTLTQTGYSMKKSLAARHAKPAGTPASKAASVPTPAAQPSTKRYGGGPPAREMTPAQKGQLRKKTNKAAAAAKPIMQQGLRSRFDVPTPKETPAPKAAAKPKAPAATTVEIKAPEMTARAFQPGKLEGETRAQTKARHVAEHAADNAAKRAEKKKVEPKNKTKAPTSAKPPSPAAVEKVSTPLNEVDGPLSTGDHPQPPAKHMYANHGQMFAEAANNRAASAASAPAKEKKAAKKEYNKYKHAASRTFNTSQRKRFGTGPGGTPATPSKPAGPKAPSGGFVSTFKPQVRTFDPMVGQKQYGLNSKPFDDSPEKHRELVKEGMKGRTGDDQRPKHVRNAAGVFVLDSGPYSDVGRREATTRMFPGTPDNPRSGQPHMTGKGAKVVGSDRNFRIWQGPNRSETVVEHRSGRQLNLPFDPKKNKNPVDNKAILDFANKNEKPFLQTTGWDGARAITQKGGRLGQIGRFSLGAAKAGGILSLPLTIAAVGSGAYLTGAQRQSHCGLDPARF